jgi:hypothetical protein
MVERTRVDGPCEPKSGHKLPSPEPTSS